MSWQDLTRKKRERITSLIRPSWRLDDRQLPSRTSCPDVVSIVPTFLSALELAITDLSVPNLLRCLHSGLYTATEVIDAYCHRAAIAHQLTQCLSEINFQSAAQRANELDMHWRARKQPIGPLHGLPVSLTDRFNIAGLDSTCGFASWANKPKTLDEEGVFIQRIRSLGAIVFCKTNVPMSMMVGETVNNITGATLNPHNRMLSAGGACGGEGALIALKGSPLGIGMDLAGSSRIPAAFNGVHALKTSEARMPQSGMASIMRGLPTAAGSVGFLSLSIDGLEIAFKALLGSNPWLDDAETFDLPWRQERFDDIAARTHSSRLLRGRLAFALLSSDNHVAPHPRVHKATQVVKSALEQCGYEVIDWQPPSQDEAVNILFRIFGSTAGKSIREAIDASGEPPIPQIRTWYEQGDVDGLSAAEFWELCHARNEYRRKYADYWREMNNWTKSGRAIDGVIQPVTATSAVREGEFHYFGYSAVANVLDFPAVAFPVDVAPNRADDDLLPFDILSETDELVRSCYRAEDAKGMPVGLQVMGQQHQEERVLAMSHAITSALTLYDTIGL